jgi:hypothetical protein
MGLVSWLVGFGWLVGIGCLVGVDLLVGWLVGQSVSESVSTFTIIHPFVLLIG